MWIIGLLILAAVIIWIVARKNPDFKEKLTAAIAAVIAGLTAFWDQIVGMFS